jgi:stage V sporulation protein R
VIRAGDTYRAPLQAIARDLGLDFHDVEFEVVPPSFMMEVAVYGLPVRMPHWSFGVRYIYQLVQHRMGHSKIFEVVFPGNPGRAYLADTNTLHENTLVIAHVLGHADFSKNNLLFRRAQEQVGYHVVEQAAAHAHHIEDAIAEHGQDRVEAVLDAALALEQHIDDDQDLNRPRYPEKTKPPEAAAREGFQRRFLTLPGEEPPPTRGREHTRVSIPPHAESDLLWFIAHYAPEMEDWERDIFLAVREESYYFHPVFACHIMNEGWASYWHARLLREAGFLPGHVYLDALKTHSDVVRPFAGDREIALSVNPYHLGFALWERIVRDHDADSARRIMREEDDCSFLHNYLDAELARELGLFRFQSRRNGEITVGDWDIDALREELLAPRYHFGAPRISVSSLGTDGTLELCQDHTGDRRGLDIDHARRVLEYIHRVWRRPVMMRTIDTRDRETVIKVGTPLH